MITATFGALAALLFGAAGWTGAMIGELLCADRTPFEDGPATIDVGHWPFAAAGACVGLAIALQGPSSVHLALVAAIVLALAGGAAADLRCGILPDVFTLAPLALVIALAAAAHNAVPAVGAVVVFVPFAIVAMATRGRGMGWGDVKLAALGGALLGVAGATLAFLVAALTAYAIARTTGGLRRTIAFGPYLAASIAATLVIVRIP